MLPWKAHNNHSKSIIADAGDLRIILKKLSSHWQLSMAIRVYSRDNSKSMFRPAIVITLFPPEHTTDEVKAMANDYVKNFASGIISVL